MDPRNRTCLLIAAVVLSITSLHVKATTYSVVDLGTLGGIECYAYGINASGQVVGGSTTEGGESHAFLYDNGVMTDLGTLGGTFSVARAINDSGVITGTADTGTGFRAFVYSGGIMTNLGTLGGTESDGLGLNNNGQIVGISFTAENATQRAFLYDNGSMIDLGTLGGYSMAKAINDSGVIVGETRTNGYSVGFRYDSAAVSPVMTAPLGNVGDSTINAINSLGQEVGYKPVGSPLQPYFYDPDNGYTVLGTLGGSYGVSYGLNNHGDVVGKGWLPGNEYQHAFIDTSHTGGWTYDLNDLIGFLPGVELVEAYGINDSGQIIANGSGPGGGFHAFLLTPTEAPEPASLALLSAGAALLLRRQRACLTVRGMKKSTVKF